MRLSDLLGADVVNLEGKKLGRVHEVRAEQNGPLQDAFGAALTIQGLILGRGGVGTRLGLDRPDAKSPAAIRVIFQGLKGPRLFLPWEKIAAIEQSRIIAAARVDELQEAEALTSQEETADGVFT